MERPGTPGYLAGLANYAGLNLRLATDGDAIAHSVIAGTRVPASGDYPLTANSKYYVRSGGVSGRHQAVAGQFPHDLVLYGFKTSLNGFRLSYLDNQVQRSATDGGIYVPYPSDFTQSFDELRLTCSGQLRDAILQGDSSHTLSYWLAPFRASTMEFRGAANAPCDTTAGVLLLGVAATLPLVPQPAHGTLGFNPDGTLVSLADGIPGVDSRLTLPSGIDMASSAGGRFKVAPVTKAYFNAWPGAGAEPLTGFLNFAAKLDLPWFLDSKVLVQAVGGGPNPLVYVMGGWNNNGLPNDPSRAWVDSAGHSFFDRQDFDASNRGYPGGVDLATFRDSGDERYRPRAQQSLLGLADANVDFAAKWDYATRTFVSGGRQGANLLIFHIQGEVERLTAAKATLNFSADVPKQPPHFSASEFLMGEIDNRTGVFTSVSYAVVHVTGDNDLARKLRSGADELDQLLSPNLGQWVGGDLLNAFDGPIDQLLTEIEAAAGQGTVSADNFQLAVCQWLGTPGNALAGLQKQYIEGAGIVDTFIRRMTNSVADVDDAVTSAISIVEPKEVEPGRFERQLFTEIVKRLVHEAPPDAPPIILALAKDVAASVVDDLIDQYASDAIDEPLGEVEDTLRSVHSELAGVLGDLTSLGGGIVDGIQQGQNALTAAGTFYQQATNAVCASLNGYTFPVTQALADRDGLKQRIKLAVLDQLLSGILPQNVSLVLKQYLIGGRGLFRGALEQLFSKVNDTIIGVAEGPLRDELKQELDQGVVKAVDQLQDILKGTRIHGSAEITGDELTKIRVDGDFQFALEPDASGDDSSLSFSAYYEMDHYQGNAPSRGCRDNAATALEVSFGANATPPGGFAKGLKLGVTGRFSLDNGGHLQGLAGGITATGVKKVGEFSAKDPQLGFSFGQEGNYLGGSISGAFKGFIIQARMFAGAACQVSDLQMIDDDTLSVLKVNGIGPGDPIAGYYIYGDVSIPIEQLLPIPIPSTCLLHLEARGGQGYFGFLTPVANPSFLVGFRQRFGLHGQLLCVLDGDGDLSLAGAVGINQLDTPQATLAGTLRVSGSVGFCPVCDDITKTLPWVAHLTSSGVIIDPPF